MPFFRRAHSQLLSLSLSDTTSLSLVSVLISVCLICRSLSLSLSLSLALSISFCLFSLSFFINHCQALSLSLFLSLPFSLPPHAFSSYCLSSSCQSSAIFDVGRKEEGESGGWGGERGWWGKGEVWPPMHFSFKKGNGRTDTYVNIATHTHTHTHPLTHSSTRTHHSPHVRPPRTIVLCVFPLFPPTPFSSSSSPPTRSSLPRLGWGWQARGTDKGGHIYFFLAHQQSETKEKS